MYCRVCQEAVNNSNCLWIGLTINLCSLGLVKRGLNNSNWLQVGLTSRLGIEGHAKRKSINKFFFTSDYLQDCALWDIPRGKSLF